MTGPRRATNRNADAAEAGNEVAERKLQRQVTAAMIRHKVEPRISGELGIFTRRYFGSTDVKRWVDLDPAIGILSIWRGQPPEEILLDDTLIAAKKPSMINFCGATADKACHPLAVYKIFDLVDFDCNKGFFNIFLNFKNPRRVLVLTASNYDEFQLWMSGLSRYIPDSVI
eukprot:TRINITY_DN103185_c0_g1_i1.p1 TRINITY_DN103185_c0_g1~~TRINITY_DN103185_c0_g1_i1.p1  ORF type:complete len:171 (+),score=28.09 TRINITY_DN103185_c0_g1_i1:73-585(+)